MQTINKFETRDELTQQLVNQVSEYLQHDIDKTGEASLAVSGGSTPVPFFKALSLVEIDWAKVTITLVDERWVEASDEASNERLVRENLLQNNASKACFIGHKLSSQSPFESVDELHDRLEALPELFSAVVLGMGEDGHTASFFPNAETLKDCIDLNNAKNCCATTPLTAPHDRMTLTLPRILKSRWLVLHLVGDAKLPVLQKAMSGSDTNEMPVRTVLNQQQTPISIYFAS